MLFLWIRQFLLPFLDSLHGRPCLLKTFLLTNNLCSLPYVPVECSNPPSFFLLSLSPCLWMESNFNIFFPPPLFPIFLPIFPSQYSLILSLTLSLFWQSLYLRPDTSWSWIDPALLRVVPCHENAQSAHWLIRIRITS